MRNLKQRYRSSDDHAGAGLRNLDSAETLSRRPCDLQATTTPTLTSPSLNLGQGSGTVPTLPRSLCL